MTSLEKFLVRRQTAKTIEDPKEKSKSGPKENNELVSTISHLKSIFPDEAEESIMLLALQYPNSHDLEVAVHKILEESGSFREVTDNWNVVKSRDKKKPEPKKRNYKKREERYENQNYPVKKPYKEESAYENTAGYSEPPKKKYVPAKAPEKKAEEVKVASPEVEEIKEIVEEKKNYGEFPELVKGYEPKIGFDQDVWGNKPNTSIAPNEIRYSEIAPEVIFSQETMVGKQGSKESAEKPHVYVEKVNSPTKEAKNVLKSDFSVQVNLDYGIPIIVYPYMFQRNREN